MTTEAQGPLTSDESWRLASSQIAEGQYEEAVKTARLGVRLDPTSHQCWTILGAVYNVFGRYDLCKPCCDRAIEIAPNLPTARWNRSWCQMWEGDWRAAWEDYEFGRVNRMRPNRVSGKEWEGQDIRGKVVLVWGEQGYGDQIQFVRYVRLLRELGAKVILEVSAPLVRLFDGTADDVCGQPEDFHLPYQFDYHAPLLSLPLKLGRLGDFWSVPPVNVRESVGGEGVGFCWKGRPTHPNDANRSASDEVGVSLLGEGVVNFTDGTDGSVCGGDFAETASRLTNVRALVTVDTAMAHLAGWLGVPCFVALGPNHDARWGKDEATPWYDSVRLVRAGTAADGLKEGMRLAQGL